MLASLTSCQSGEVRATKIEFTSPFSIIEEGESVDLGITVYGPSKEVTYTLSDDDFASIDSENKMKTTKTGFLDVTATSTIDDAVEANTRILSLPPYLYEIYQEYYDSLSEDINSIDVSSVFTPPISNYSLSIDTNIEYGNNNDSKRLYTNTNFDNIHKSNHFDDFVGFLPSKYTEADLNTDITLVKEISTYYFGEYEAYSAIRAYDNDFKDTDDSSHYVKFSSYDLLDTFSSLIKMYILGDYSSSEITSRDEYTAEDLNDLVDISEDKEKGITLKSEGLKQINEIFDEYKGNIATILNVSISAISIVPSYASGEYDHMTMTISHSTILYEAPMITVEISKPKASNTNYTSIFSSFTKLKEDASAASLFDQRAKNMTEAYELVGDDVYTSTTYINNLEDLYSNYDALSEDRKYLVSHIENVVKPKALLKIYSDENKTNEIVSNDGIYDLESGKTYYFTSDLVGYRSTYEQVFSTSHYYSIDDQKKTLKATSSTSKQTIVVTSTLNDGLIVEDTYNIDIS
jgi:hypothetical protein